MSKVIQLRNVPDALHRSLKARAALAVMALSNYLLAEIKEIAERPALAELRERLHRHMPVSAQLDTARSGRNFSANDAAYIVLAEKLRAALITRDARFASNDERKGH